MHPELEPSTPASSAAEAGPAGRTGLLVMLLSMVDTVPSGGDRLVMELARRWPDRGGKVTLLTTAAGAQYLKGLSAENLAIRLLTGFGTRSRSVLVAYLMRTLIGPFAARRAMRQDHPGIAMSSSPFPPDLAAALTAKAMGARWVHSWQLVIPSPRSGYQLAEERQSLGRLLSPRRIGGTVRLTLSYLSQNLSLALARRWCSTLVVPTELMAAEAVRRGIARDRVHVATYGIDFAEITSEVARGRDPSLGSFDAVFLGRLHAQKGLDDLLAVWKLVQASLPGARLAVIGDGRGLEADEFKRRALRFAGGTVSLMGVITGPEKYALMSSAEVFLFPSHHESWGHVALEAMAVGLPVIGYDLPSSREVFGSAMLRVPCYDVSAFARTAISCLRDEGTRERYRGLGLELARQRDWAAVAHGFAQRLLG